MRVMWIALAAFSLAGAQALAQDAPPVPVELSPIVPGAEYLGRPKWVHAPTPKELAALYPEPARQAQVRGRVVIDCQFTAEGWLTNCIISSEAPPGYGFARATARAMRSFQAAPRAEDGRPVSGFRVLMRVNWAPPSPGSEGPRYEMAATSVPIPPSSEPTGSAGSPPSPAPNPPPGAAPPSWERVPSADELAALYPREAMAKGLGGDVVMRCKVTRDGTLTDCTITQETPPDLGFGAATLAAARYFKMTPKTPDGTPVEGGSVLIPLKWRLG